MGFVRVVNPARKAAIAPASAARLRLVAAAKASKTALKAGIRFFGPPSSAAPSPSIEAMPLAPKGAPATTKLVKRAPGGITQAGTMIK
mmetsp:Transcript_16627/g.30893  ORF Transcript_16627/g.30893 Transcript_16627/m.30893 type:complete len:88 (+) Transcript_16627:817-1080(+)